MMRPLPAGLTSWMRSRSARQSAPSQTKNPPLGFTGRRASVRLRSRAFPCMRNNTEIDIRRSARKCARDGLVRSASGVYWLGPAMTDTSLRSLITEDPSATWMIFLRPIMRAWPILLNSTKPRHLNRSLIGRAGLGQWRGRGPLVSPGEGAVAYTVSALIVGFSV